MEHLTLQSFKEKVFDIQSGGEWKFAGTRPCIIDFYAIWCGPCKMLSPILEQVAEKYAGKVDVYKIDTDQEAELSAAFGIQTVPTILFVPLNGKPVGAKGVMPKESFDKAIEQVFGIKA